ncbi:hypothetical protein ABI59_04245 [Acidobacteria bacterium Mor1]|nr:hypothetical protein ABI59_04245 [Acidobacteria bacterium Mor1]
MKIALRIAAALALLAAGVAAFVLFQGYRELHRPYAAWQGDEVVVELPRGMAAATMLERLSEAGVLTRALPGRVWLRLKGSAGSLRAGEYRFHQAASAVQVLERLQRGDVLLHPVTIPEGLVMEEIAQRFADAGVAEYEPLLAAMQDPAPIHDLVPEAEHLDGYLFPDTYHFPRGEDPRRIVAAMVAGLREIVDKDYIARAAEASLSVTDAVALASMIEKETGVPDERWRISGVFHNRLRRGMKMQCDPTVMYGMLRAGTPVKRLLRKHLDHDSPWNTYVIGRLPVSPICNPGRESLDAAIRPLDTRELYFVAAPGGGHTFSESLAEHQRAVNVWYRHLRASR